MSIGTMTGAQTSLQTTPVARYPLSGSIPRYEAELPNQTFGAVDVSGREATFTLTSANGCATVLNRNMASAKRRGDRADCNFSSEVGKLTQRGLCARLHVSERRRHHLLFNFSSKLVKLMHRGLSARLLESERRRRHLPCNFSAEVAKLRCRGFLAVGACKFTLRGYSF